MKTKWVFVIWLVLLANDRRFIGVYWIEVLRIKAVLICHLPKLQLSNAWLKYFIVHFLVLEGIESVYYFYIWYKLNIME